MDYAGLDYRNIRFPVDRPLTEEEKNNRYLQGRSINSPAMDYMSVINFNSNYIDLVDRWYFVKGFNTWLGICVIFFGIFAIFAMVFGLFLSENRLNVSYLDYLLFFIFTMLSFFLVFAGYWLVRTETARWTHYPMRLNRKTRQVYFFRQNGTVCTASWDDLYLVLGTAKSPLTDTTYDLRAHVMDESGTLVKESFTIGYPSPVAEADAVDNFWAFLQPYMEASDGVEKAYSNLKENSYILPLDGRKEGWRWSIFSSFSVAAPWPWLQLIASPAFGLNVLGRMFAMWTSKLPQWPDEIAAQNPVDANDPYILTWKENASLGWRDLWWPLICTVVGLAVFFGLIASIFMG
ncbi:DUF6708 domain-containing protein [Comamonas sp. NoAH]|uniref:DUF6708 domain-containing protein n=1 Tax=Comamonas halotolerans TaxID=3041496 RepID=UPI0024E07B4C|nr:DUF6708 domain-containing protein [Comamonas sp. NoAH]